MKGISGVSSEWGVLVLLRLLPLAPPNIPWVSSAIDPHDKVEAYEELRLAGVEGVVFKDINTPSPDFRNWDRKSAIFGLSGPANPCRCEGRFPKPAVVKTHPLPMAGFPATIRSRPVLAQHQTVEGRQGALLLVTGGEPALQGRAGPTTDGRKLLFNRHTMPDKVQKLLISQLELELPPQSPPRITSNQTLESLDRTPV